MAISINQNDVSQFIEALSNFTKGLIKFELAVIKWFHDLPHDEKKSMFKTQTVSELEQSLNHYISQEDYTTCAIIRDCISELKYDNESKNHKSPRLV